MKRIWTQFGIALVAPILLWSGTAFGQAAKPPVHQGSTPSSVEGQVVKIDKPTGRVTIKASDGSTHEFTGVQGDARRSEGGRPHRGAAPPVTRRSHTVPGLNRLGAERDRATALLTRESRRTVWKARRMTPGLPLFRGP